MNYVNPLPPTLLIDPTDIAYFARVDPSIASTPQEVTVISNLIQAATAYAENAMATSLLNRTIMATFWHDGLGEFWAGTWHGRGRRVALPRGPIVSVATVTDAGRPVTGWQLQGAGNADLLYLPGGWQGPLVVTYVAGYGPTPASVPPDVLQAIRTHVGTMYENRESVSDKAMVPVPHTLEAFYNWRCRSSPVG